MTKTELLNRYAKDAESRLLYARILDKAAETEQRSTPSNSPFLSENEQARITDFLTACRIQTNYCFTGGYAGAERKICLFLPEWMAVLNNNLPEEDEIPLSVVRARYSDTQQLSHRDFLGALMGLGLTREKVGDILVGNGSCDIILLPEAAPIVLDQLQQAGKCRLQLEQIPLHQLSVPERRVSVVKDTVPALRLDAVASSGFRLARGKMSDLIRAGHVEVNHRSVEKSDFTVKESDIITCRGLGRIRLKHVGGLSRKGRINVEIERYL